MARFARTAALLALAAGCAHSNPSEMAADRPDAEYRIGREDVLEVVVWHEPELTRVVPVRPDGKISLPIAGEVDAAGRTPAELQDTLARALAPYVHDVTVAVLVREINAARFYVLGEVTHPGAFPLRGYVSVVQAIAMAGGRTEFGGDDVVWLRQEQGGKTKRVRVSFRELVQGEVAGALALRGGDVIYVP